MKVLMTLLVAWTLSLGVSAAYAGGTLGGNVACDSGAVNVGNATCGK